MTTKTEVERCQLGHVYDKTNTYWAPSGSRDCRICVALRSRRANWKSATAMLELWPSKNMFDVIYPNANLIDIKDIVHALANICRFTGHIRRRYSVLAHSLQVSKWIEFLGGSPLEILTGLMHDASEYVCNDIASPLKTNLRRYIAIENMVQRVIANKYRLPYPFPSIVHMADQMAYRHEAVSLKDMKYDLIMSTTICDGSSSPEVITSDTKLKREFISRFDELMELVNA